MGRKVLDTPAARQSAKEGDCTAILQRMMKARPMTVMFPRFFGIPQAVCRLDMLRGLSGPALKVYIALCHESERCSNRQLTRTTIQLQKLVGCCRNTHAKARDELVRAGLLKAEPYGSDGFVFELCNPETGEPWPLNSRERVLYSKTNSTDAVGSHPKVALQAEKQTKTVEPGVDFSFGHNASGTNSAKAIEPDSMLTWNDIGA